MDKSADNHALSNASIDGNKRWYSTLEAGHFIGVVRTEVIRLIQTGVLPGYRTPGGRQYRVKRQDLDAFIEASKVQPEQGEGE